MYLKRIEIFDTRAISHLVVDDLDEQGVVVISGPNETGKSTIADAVKAALTLKASSNAKEVKSLRSSTGGEYPRIVLDLRLGGYDFRLDKTFKGGRNSTVLDIEKPSRRTLHDNDAHQWLEELINSEQTKDVWSIFVAEQGQAQQALSLGQFGSLTGALQEATGEAPETAGERNVMDAVTAEYKKYYTENSGAERKELKDSHESVREAERRVHEAQEVVRDFDALNAEAAQKDREITKLKTDLPQAEHEVAEREKAVAKLGKFKEAVAETNRVATLAAKDAEHARQAQRARLALIKKVDDARADAEKLDDAATAASKKAEEEAVQFDDANERAQKANKEAQRAQAVVRLIEAEQAFFETSERIGSLEGTLREVEGLNAQLTKLDEELSAFTVSEDDVEELRNAVTEQRTAMVALEAASPRVELSAVKNATVGVDGADTELLAGAEPYSMSVTSKTTLEIGDVTVAITTGNQAGDLRTEFERARSNLEEMLDRLEVDSLEAAVELNRQRKKLESQRDKSRGVLSIKLENRDYLALQSELKNSRAELERNKSHRETCLHKLGKQSDDFVRPTDAAGARKMLIDARQDWADADERREQLSTTLSRLADKPMHTAAHIAKTKAESQSSLVDALQKDLESAREMEADVALFSRVERREAEAEEAESARKAAVAKLESLDAEEADLNLQGALGALKNKRTLLAKAQSRRSEIQGELNRFESANEQLSDATEHLERVQRDHESLVRRARAAKLLFETLRDARRRTREAIAEPLLAKMREYGGSIFGKGTEFEMSDDLQIISRSSNEGTFEHGSLSGGAKEQIDILLRLAAAGVMEGGAGAPVIIDDALGYSDEQRLRLMNNAIARAGERNQVIVLTCDYERFQYVSGATHHAMNELLIS